MWLLDLIRTELDVKYRQEFSESNVVQNRSRSLVLSILIIALEVIILINTYRPSVALLYGSYLNIYRGLYLFMIIGSVLGAMALQLLKNHLNAHVHLTRLLVTIFVLVINWGVVISIIDGTRDIHSNSYFFMFIALTISVIIVMRPMTSLLLFGSSLLIYVSLTYVFITDTTTAFGNYINGISVYSTTWIISMLFYKYKADDFIQQKIISEQNEQLKTIASTDPLTGIYNRRALEHELDRIFDQSFTMNAGMLVMMIDVDDYKGYNDLYGHIKGDQVLVQIAKALKGVVGGRSSVISRYGGDEFCLVLACDSKAKSQHIRDLIHEEIRRLAIENKASNTSDYVTVSVGLKYVVPAQDDSPWSYIEAADKDLYEFKTNRKKRRIND